MTRQPINEPPQASAGGSQPADESTERPNGHLGAVRSEGTISAGKGPASGSPDGLVERLEEARDRWPNEPYHLPTLLGAAAQAIRALEAERDDYKSDYFRRHKDACDNYEQVLALQHQLTHARERLKQCLDVLEDIGPMDWIAKIRKDAGV